MSKESKDCVTAMLPIGDVKLNVLQGSRTNQTLIVRLANIVPGGNIQLLADAINKSLERVSADLKPLDDTHDTTCIDIPEQFIIYPEEFFKKLELINTRKAPGPDN